MLCTHFEAKPVWSGGSEDVYLLLIDELFVLLMLLQHIIGSLYEAGHLVDFLNFSPGPFSKIVIEFIKICLNNLCNGLNELFSGFISFVELSSGFKDFIFIVLEVVIFLDYFFTY